jgi:hypothetical protein
MKNIDIPSMILFGITIVIYGLVVYYIIATLQKHQKALASKKFSSRTKNRMLFSIVIRSRSIHEIVYTLFGLFFFTWLSLLRVGALIATNNSGESYLAFATAISTPILGFCGQVQYIRNETPGKYWGESIQEPFAKLIGGATMLLGYGGAIVSLVYGLFIWPR